MSAEGTQERPGTVHERAVLPAGDVRLGDDRLLRCTGPWPDRRVAAAVLGSDAEHTRGYVYEGPKRLRVLATLDDTEQWGPLLHVSLSYPDHNPSWRDIRLIKDAFYGTERDAMMVLPRQADYINIHEHCFQLWECPQHWRMQ